MKTWKLIAAIAVLRFTSLVSADPIVEDDTYVLGNHPDGGAADPLYGLRLDGLLTGNTNEIYTFDFDRDGALMQMLWDGTADTIRIWGDAYGGQDGGSAYLAVTACGGGSSGVSTPVPPPPPPPPVPSAVGLDTRPNNQTCIAPARPTANASVSVVDAFPSLPDIGQPTRMIL